jgi:hypothetical protein
MKNKKYIKKEDRRGNSRAGALGRGGGKFYHEDRKDRKGYRSIYSTTKETKKIHKLKRLKDMERMGRV